MPTNLSIFLRPYFFLLIPVIACLPPGKRVSDITPETKGKPASQNSTRKPNIIIFYVDDLGYGDLGCYGSPMAKTPFIDSLSKTGVRFTDAHSTAATCTPSRYSLLTGEYAFRSKARILEGDAPLLIKEDQPTLATLLGKAGYTTGVVGKWHLGLGNGIVNWNGSVKPGPKEIGFDYNFLLPATGDRVPTVYLENDKVVNANSSDPIEVSYVRKLEGYPNGIESPGLLRQKADTQHSNTIVNGISRIGFMKGGKDALWKDEDFPSVFVDKANRFIEQNKEKPFFLFFSFHDIHVPRLPNENFKGKSEMGVRGDAIMQMDWTTAQVVNQLKKLNLDKETIIIFTSDNGPVLNDGYEDMAAELVGNHKPGGVYRGGKYSAFEAGTRVPLIITWPGRIKGQTSDAMVNQLDFYRSFAEMLELPVEKSEAIDSEDHWKTFTGEIATGRKWMLEESFTLSARKDNWKYIAPIPPENKVPAFMANKGIESGVSKQAQLYNLKNDPSEKNNLAEKNPDIVRSMQAYIDAVKKRK